MNIPGTIGLKMLLSVSALAGGAVVFAAPVNGHAPDAAVQPTHATQTLPAALRPVFYQSLAKDAGPAYALNAKGCATLPRSSLTACFDAAGAHFNSKDATPLALHLAGVGRGNDLAAVPTVQPAIAGNQVSYTHGALSEWWRVLPVGFEQGFTVAKRPGGAGELVLALGGNKQASRQDAGAPVGTLAFGKLRYGQLVVTDANGKVVPAILTNKGNRILITVNDVHAAYPLTVDPLVWLEQKVTASDGGADNGFGYSVAVAGTTALIGAPGATVGGNLFQGVAYAFSESGGTWSQTAELTGSDGAANDGFGTSVALAGSTALVGAYDATVNGNAQQGAAYVFTESGDTWSQTAKLTASDGEANDHFGASVALAGGTALVGAYYATVNGNQDQGAAYVFGEAGGVWSQTQKLTASDGEANDLFGASVALAGGTALVGAYYAAVDGDQRGAAYVFTESGDTWSQTAKLTASDGEANDLFGASVALAGGTALVGAPNAAVNDNLSQGAAYVFSDSGGNWTQTQKLTASDGAANGFFGFSVALAGSAALVGAIHFTINGEDQPGETYLFGDSGGTWMQTQKLIANDGVAGDFFGFSVALAGSTALVGAYAATVNGNIGQGAAYFEGESNLGLAVSAPQTLGQGQQYVSQTIATNNASVTSPAVAVTITVPAAASFVSASATQGSCSEASGLVTCDFGQINANAGTATANVTLKAIGGIGTVLENKAGVVLATPALTAGAATLIVGNCPDGYTRYDGNLLGGTRAIYAAYYAPAGEQNAILAGPAGFHMFALVKTATGLNTYRFSASEVHRRAPAGIFEWGVRAGSQGGYFTLCIQHP